MFTIMLTYIMYIIQVVQDKQTEWRLMKDLWFDFFADNVLALAISGLNDSKYKDNLLSMLQHNFTYDEE